MITIDGPLKKNLDIMVGITAKLSFHYEETSPIKNSVVNRP